jgi:dTDP-4-dehydrorhamnose 3,5-epimerase
VDVRWDSPTFGQWVGARLSADNHQQLWVPAGFAHGFLTLSALAEVLYKTTDVWSRDCERALRWDDPELAITWPLEASLPPQLSEKDAAAPLLAEVRGELLGCVWSSVQPGQNQDAASQDPSPAGETR